MSESEHAWAGHGEPTEETKEAGRKAFDADNAGEPGPGRVISEEERKGVEATDTSAQTPLGVGDSVGRRAEETALREEEKGATVHGAKGASERPHGKATDEDGAGVQGGLGGNLDAESPEMPTGDQGG